jgi:hypothetical protein
VSDESGDKCDSLFLAPDLKQIFQKKEAAGFGSRLTPELPTASPYKDDRINWQTREKKARYCWKSRILGDKHKLPIQAEGLVRNRLHYLSAF